MSENVKQVLVIRKDLKMPDGKAVAQGAHASLKAVMDLGTKKEAPESGQVLEIPYAQGSALQLWAESDYKKICLAVESEEELVAIYTQAAMAKLPVAFIIDNGLTIFKGEKNPTVVAIGPCFSSEVDPITGHLPLYKRG